MVRCPLRIVGARPRSFAPGQAAVRQSDSSCHEEYYLKYVDDDSLTSMQEVAKTPLWAAYVERNGAEGREELMRQDVSEFLAKDAVVDAEVVVSTVDAIGDAAASTSETGRFRTNGRSPDVSSGPSTRAEQTT